MINENSGYEHIVNVEKNNHFFTACVDNFFKDPGLIRNFALGLEYKKDNLGRWPGKRSLPLHLIDNEFSISLLLKIFSIYVDLNVNNIKWENSEIYFHKNNNLDNNKENIKNKGWIHKDEDWDFAGIIYLTPDVDIQSGTSLYNLKEEFKNEYSNIRNYYKHMFYNNEKIDMLDYEKSYNNFNNMFLEKTNFSNIYNRLVCYDANEFHSIKNLHTKNNERLTLVFFVRGISFLSYKSPIDKIQQIEKFDNFFKSRIKILNENPQSQKKLSEQTSL
jgi:hypothetical protein